MNDDKQNVSSFGKRAEPPTTGEEAGAVNVNLTPGDLSLDHPTPLKGILRAAAGVAAQSDFGRLAASSARLLDIKRAQLLRGEHEHEIGRARILADGRRELEELRQRIRHQVDQHDDAWGRVREDLVDEIGRLEMMKEAADG